MLKRLVIFTVALWIAALAMAAEGDINFYKTDKIYGVTLREPSSICRDKDGFIWVAAQSKIYRLANSVCHDYTLPNELSNLVMIKVKSTPKDVYAYTNQGEVFRYDSRMDRFERLFSISDITGGERLMLSDIAVDESGRVWTATSYGLLCYDGAQLRLVDTLTDVVSCIVGGKRGWIIVAGPNGLYQVNHSTLAVKTLYNAPGGFPTSLSYDRKYGNVWIGTKSNGVFIYNEASRELTRLNVSNFPCQSVKDIEIVGDSTVWCGIDGRGIWSVARDGSRLLSTYTEDSDREFSLKGNGVYDILYERPGVAWVCTFTGGLQMSYASPAFIGHHHRPGVKGSLVNDFVYAVYEDRNNQLWAATNGGLSCLNRRDNTWTNLLNNISDESLIIRTLCEDVDGNLWVGTYSHGIYVIDPRSRAIVAHHTDTSGLLSPMSFVYDIIRSRNGDMWVVGMIGKILRFDREKRQFESYPSAAVSKAVEFDDNILMLVSTHNLLALDRKTRTITTLYSGDLIQDIDIVKEKVLLSTNGSGVVIYDPATGRSESLTTRKGLVSNNVISLVDDGNTVWLATDVGLCSYDMDSKVVNTYVASALYPYQSFLPGGAVRLTNGNIVWATSNGVVISDPNRLVVKSSSGRIFLQDIILSGRSLREYPDLMPKETLDSLTSFEVSHAVGSNISFELISLENFSGAALLSWRLEGVDENWTEPAPVHNISYSNLPPGDYSLAVRLYNPNLTAERVIRFTVLPPFWATWWFRLLMILLILGCGWGGLRFYVTRLNRRNAENKLRFFVNTAHELRTALTLIKAPIDELSQSSTLSAQDQKCLDFAGEQVKRLTDITSQLLDFQKVDMGRDPLTLTECDMVEVVAQRVSMFMSLASRKKIAIDYRHTVKSCLTGVDRQKIERVIDNLLSNAIKYSPEGTEIKVDFSTTATHWRLSVADKGIGLSSSARRQLFNAFYRSESAINANIAGSGLGLALSRRLIDIHKGKITVDSVEGQGSTFTVTVPMVTELPASAAVEDAKPSEISVAQEETLRSDIAEERMRILLCEDNDDLREFMSGPLSQLFTVATAADGEEAWEMIQRDMPDLVVTDIMMPNIDGFELCRLIKTSFDTAHIPVIIVSALDDLKDEIHGFSIGADDYVRKPFDMSALEMRITSTIRNRRMLAAQVAATQSKQTSETDEEKGVESVRVTPQLNDTFVQDAMSVVMRHLDDADFDKESFAKEMGVSASLLFKKLKALSGLSIIDFIKKVRMDCAARFIESGQYNIGEVADKCGFSSIAYFSTVFKKHYGVSPSEYRRN